MKSRFRALDNYGSFENKRRAVCEEAARIMQEQGIRDFQMAKIKAIERLGAGRRFPLPSNREVEAILQQRLDLFGGESRTIRHHLLWQTATEIMEMFSSFEPRLVGALLRGIVTNKTPVELHLFTDCPEQLADSFAQLNVPYESFDKRVRYKRKQYSLIPAFRFARNDVSLELLAFQRKGIREAPLCPVEGRPMPRIALARAREMLSTA